MTENKKIFNAGSQVDSQILYQRQQQSKRRCDPEAAPVIVATGLRTPANIASVLRIADAVYAPRVIFVTQREQKIDFANKIQRLSRNTHTDIQIEQYELDAFLHLCDHLPTMIAIEITTQSENIFTTHLPTNCSLVIGSESHGVSKRVLAKCQSAVHIPMYGKNGSMNLSHALAIGLFEWRRQRQSSDKD